MTPERRDPIQLRIRVVDAKVEAELVVQLGPREEVEPLDYLAVHPDGLEFGTMNGMRPAGLIVQSGKLNGDVLEGESGFRGIVVPLPTGFSPPPMYFRLTRAPARR